MNEKFLEIIEKISKDLENQSIKKDKNGKIKEDKNKTKICRIIEDSNYIKCMNSVYKIVCKDFSKKDIEKDIKNDLINDIFTKNIISGNLVVWYYYNNIDIGIEYSTQRLLWHKRNFIYNMQNYGSKKKNAKSKKS